MALRNGTSVFEAAPDKGAAVQSIQHYCGKQASVVFTMRWGLARPIVTSISSHFSGAGFEFALVLPIFSSWLNGKHLQGGNRQRQRLSYVRCWQRRSGIRKKVRPASR